MVRRRWPAFEVLDQIYGLPHVKPFAWQEDFAMTADATRVGHRVQLRVQGVETLPDLGRAGVAAGAIILELLMCRNERTGLKNSPVPAQILCCEPQGDQAQRQPDHEKLALPYRGRALEIVQGIPFAELFLLRVGGGVLLPLGWHGD
jgi:hypothetical protein